MYKLKIGIIGVGQIACNSHIPNYILRFKDVEIVGLCDVNYEYAKKVAKQFNIEKVFVDLYNETSYQYTVFLNQLYFSYYTLSEQLMDTYGIPKSRNSKQVIWQDEQKQVSLEYPAIIKYTYLPVLVDVLRLQNRELETKTNEGFDYKERELILNDL